MFRVDKAGIWGRRRAIFRGVPNRSMVLGWYQGGTRLLPVCPGAATCHSHYCECLYSGGVRCERVGGAGEGPGGGDGGVGAKQLPWAVSSMTCLEPTRRSADFQSAVPRTYSRQGIGYMSARGACLYSVECNSAARQIENLRYVIAFASLPNGAIALSGPDRGPRGTPRRESCCSLLEVGRPDMQSSQAGNRQ